MFTSKGVLDFSSKLSDVYEILLSSIPALMWEIFIKLKSIWFISATFFAICAAYEDDLIAFLWSEVEIEISRFPFLSMFAVCKKSLFWFKLINIFCFY